MDRKPETRELIQTPPKRRRINRILSLAGLTSRRTADEWIKAGRVRVNNTIVRQPGAQALWGKDSIRVDGEEIPGPSQRVYLMLNKPFGYVCTLKDPEGRPIVGDLLKGVTQRVYPVGRLDFDSLGLLLLTNDGEWAHRLTHPRFHVPKTYKVTVAGALPQEVLKTLGQGVLLDDGFSRPSRVTLLRTSPNQSLIRMTITSGRRRVVRRMFEALGYQVVHLVRIGFGTLELGDLKLGQFRLLETSEVEELKKMVGLR